MMTKEPDMSLLIVIHDRVTETYVVVNTFDGVVVERFYTHVDAEDFARSAEANEAHRIQVEYPDS
jgi:hypothetical protein